MPPPAGDLIKEDKKKETVYVKPFNPIKISRTSIVKRFAAQRGAAGITLDTPLGELREALEDESEADKFLMDPMFWKNIDSIDQRRILRTSSVEYRNLKIMCGETCCYFIFLIFFTVYIFGLQSQAVYESRTQQKDYWLGCTATDCSVDKIDDIASFWRWMKDDFVDSAFTEGPAMDDSIANITTRYGNNGYTITHQPRMVGETNTNVLLGALRFRQVRVGEDTGCEVDPLFRHVFPHCYPAFLPVTQSFEDFGTRYTPKYTMPAFEWRNERESLGTWLSGTLAWYPGDGFFIDLPTDRASASSMLEDLHEWAWVDRLTRAVIVEFTVLNTNTNVLINSRLLFEFSPSGTVTSLAKVNAFRVLFVTLAVDDNAELFVFLFMVIVILFFAVFIIYLLWQIKRVGVKFFTYSWNLLDILIAILLFTYFMIRFSVMTNVENEPSLAPNNLGHPEDFMGFSRNLDALIRAQQILSFCALLIYLRGLKYTVIFERFRLLITVVQDCFSRLLVFAVLIIIFFTGFGIAFFIALGQTAPAYQSLSTSFPMLFFMLIEGVSIDAQWFEPNGPMVGSVLSLGYLILVYFILGNMFMAITLEAYVGNTLCRDVRATEEDLQKKNPIQLFLVTYYNHKKGISIDNDEEVPEEYQKIPLEKLPGIVTRKWLEKKRRMQLLVDEKLGDVTEGELKRKNSKMHQGPQSKEERRKKKRGFTACCAKLKYTFLKALSCPTKEDFEIPEPDLDDNRVMLHPDRAYEGEVVSVTQLQRLLDQEPMLQILVGSSGLSCIKHFIGDTSYAGEILDDDASEDMDDPLRKVAELQEKQFKKVDNLEKAGLSMDCKDVPQVKNLTNELNQQLQEVQNGWREEFVAITDVASELAMGFTTLQEGIGKLIDNNRELRATVLGDESSYYSDTGSSSLTSSNSSYSSEGKVERTGSKGFFG